MSTKRKVVVVGGAVSGPAAAIAAARYSMNTKGAAEILLFERAPNIGFAVGGLSYYISREVERIDDLIVLPENVLTKKYGVKVRMGYELCSLDAEQKKVVFRKGGRRHSEEYDALVMATGARTFFPDKPSQEADNVFKFRSPADLRAVEEYLDRHKVRVVAIVGGGFFGIESAEAFRRAGFEVHLIEKTAHVLERWHDDFSVLVEQELARNGVEVQKNTVVVDSPLSSKKVRVVRLANGSKISVDLVLICAGIKPNAELLLDAGAAPGPQGTVAVDKFQLTTLADVFAAGVCTSFPHHITGKPTWCPQALIAHRMGIVAGRNAVGAECAFEGVAFGTAITRVFDAALGRTGLTEKEAAEYLGGKRKLSIVQSESTHAEPFMESARSFMARVVLEKRSGRVLGAEAWGYGGVDKFIDTMATAIAAKLSIDQMALLDLTYSPPFSPLDNIMSRLADEQVR